MLEFLFNKIAGLQTCNFIKNRLQYRCFTVKFAKFFKSTYFEEHPRTTASKNRDSFLEVFCRSCCSALILWWNIALPQQWLKVGDSSCKFTKNCFPSQVFFKEFTTIAEQRHWKMHLDSWFWRRIYFGNISAWLLL